MNKMTVTKLLEKKKKGERITMITAYDYPFAKLVEEAEADILLVGDSLGMVVLGYPDTLSVTMDDMLRHTQAVSRGVQNTFLVADMPFLSYQVNEEEALRNAGRLVSEGGAKAVKLEGGEAVLSIVKKIVFAGIPVMGHLGLTPQSVHALGGYKVQGTTQEKADELLTDAKSLEKSGCFAIVLECVPEKLAETITKSLTIPVIGIGAGKKCDGQVLVIHDCLGFTAGYTPKFAKQFANLSAEALKGLRQYVKEVREGQFP